MLTTNPRVFSFLCGDNP